MRAAVLILGVGNADRGDDGVGPAVVARLRGRLPPGVEARVARADAADLMAAWDGRDGAIVVDATRSGADPGTVRRFAAEGQALPAATGGDPSSHALGVAQAIELARVLGRLPGRLTVFGVEALQFELGAGLSPAVARAVDAVADRVLLEAAPGPGA